MIPSNEESNTTQVIVATKVAIPRELGCSYQFGSPSPVAATESTQQNQSWCWNLHLSGEGHKKEATTKVKQKMKSIDLKHLFVSENDNTSTGYISSGHSHKKSIGESTLETILYISVKPWVVDQVWETAVCAHSQAIKSDAPFDWLHYPSADYNKIGSRLQTVIHQA